MSKLSKKPTVRQKFAIELPKLWLGPSKTFSDRAANGIESEPPTPKSVRPPLSPKIDHELRQACSLVLRDFKPSQQQCEEHGKSPGKKRPQGEYKPYHQLREEALKEIRRRELKYGRYEVEPSSDLLEVRSTSEPNLVRGSIHSTQLEQTAVDSLDMKPRIESRTFFEGNQLAPVASRGHGEADVPETDLLEDEPICIDLSSLDSPIANQRLFENVDQERIQIVAAPGTQDTLPLLSPDFFKPDSIPPLNRSLSNPQHSRDTSVEEAGNRSESARTTTSVPQTDCTSEHSRNVSTAPTSTAITPARSSMHKFSQTAGLSTGKSFTGDVEWMQLELENQRRAEEVARTQQELENGGCSAAEVEDGSSDIKNSRSGLAADQQVGRLSIQERRNAPPVPHLDGRQSRNFTRSESRRQRSTPRSESTQELEMLRSDSALSQQSVGHDDGAGTAGTINNWRTAMHDLKKPSQDRIGSPCLEVSRASSRSRRMFQIHRPPRDGTITPPASLANSNADSRSMSIASPTAATNDVGSKLLRVNSDQGKDDMEDPEADRLHSQSSRRHSSHSRRNSQQSADHQRKSKSPMNLNRELPPLPSLDQWKPVELERPKHISTLASPTSGDRKGSDATSALESPYLDVHGDFLDIYDKVSVSSSRIHSIYSRYSKIPEDWSPPDDVPPYPPLPIDADLAESNNHERFALDDDHDQSPLPTPLALPTVSIQHRVPSEYMFHANFADMALPASPLQATTEPTPESKTLRRRTEDMFLPDLDARARVASTSEPPTALPDLTKKPPVVNFSRGLQKQRSILQRKNTAPAKISTQANISAPITEDNQVRNSEPVNSEQTGLSRQPSVQNYNRLYGMGYRNIIQIQPIHESDVQPASTSPGLTRSLSKRWWKRGTSKREKSSLMTQ